MESGHNVCAFVCDSASQVSGCSRVLQPLQCRRACQCASARQYLAQAVGRASSSRAAWRLERRDSAAAAGRAQLRGTAAPRHCTRCTWRSRALNHCPLATVINEHRQRPLLDLNLSFKTSPYKSSGVAAIPRLPTPIRLPGTPNMQVPLNVLDRTRTCPAGACAGRRSPLD